MSDHGGRGGGGRNRSSEDRHFTPVAPASRASLLSSSKRDGLRIVLPRVCSCSPCLLWVRACGLLPDECVPVLTFLAVWGGAGLALSSVGCGVHVMPGFSW